jgi:cation diffusion facilitator family transporter
MARISTQSPGLVTVIAALVGNLLVAATKIAAAVVTGSSAMLSEAIHSVVDTGNETLLLYGIRRSKRRPDREHPLGYGRELYFWSFLVALMLFGAGACASVVQGILHIRNPVPLEKPLVAYVVLGLALVFEGGSWLIAYRGFRSDIDEAGVLAAIRRSKDPPQFMVLMEDSAAIAGIMIALLGTWASFHFRDPRLDGLASILIGILLGAVALLLARESKALLIGERGDPALQELIFRLALETPGIVRPNALITVQLAPKQVVASLSVEFDDDLKIPDVEALVTDLEGRIRKCRPEVYLLFVKPQTPRTFEKARERRIRHAPA